MAHYSRLTQGGAAFDEMIQRFGVVTVMNALVYDSEDLAKKLGHSDGILGGDSACEVLAKCGAWEGTEDSKSHPLCKLDTLKIANITQEGPTKTVTGGQNASPLLKFGKTARLEMQDALGNNEALDALCGTVTEYLGEPEEAPVGSASEKYANRFALHAGDEFGGPKTIVGDSFFINQKNGAQVKVKILVYQFLPDSVFNLTQDAEGDATVFDLNGDLIATKVILGDSEGKGIEKNIFYSIIDPEAESHSEPELTTVGE